MAKVSKKRRWICSFWSSLHFCNCHNHFCLRTSFSVASSRIKIFDAISCGRSSRYRYYNDNDNVGGGNGNVSLAIRSLFEIVKERVAVRPKWSNMKTEKLFHLLNWSHHRKRSPRRRRCWKSSKAWWRSRRMRIWWRGKWLRVELGCL